MSSQPVYESGQYRRLTASGPISGIPCNLMGFHVASTAAGTIVLNDGQGGPQISGIITPDVGFVAYPASCGFGLYATITGAIDVTFFYIPGQ